VCVEKPFPAYQGDEAYAFVCYAHEDSAIVYPEMAWLCEQGLNLWYDEGIAAGKNWRSATGDSLLGANHVLFYISEHSLKSDHCNREINLALDEGKDVIPVYIQDVELTTDLKVGLNRVQALHRDQDANYQQHLLNALGQSAAIIEPQPTPVTTGPKSRFAVSVVMGGALLLLIYAGWWLWQQPVDSKSVAITEKKLPSIAVLPFVNMSNDPDQEYFSEGVAEEILSLLARNQELKVISRSSAFSFKGKGLEVPVIASQLGVEHVLEGSVRKSGNVVRVTTQLIHAATDRYLWSETFDRNLDDAFAVQTEIATRVAEQLNVELLDLKPPTHTTNSEAYPLYSQARQILSLAGTLDDTLRAKSLLDRAIEVDPSYVPAWRELSRAFEHLTSHGVYTEEEGNDLSDSARAQALVLDPYDAVANAWVGWTLVVRDNKFEKGVQYFKKGLSLDPTNLDILRPAVPLLHWFRKYEESLRLAEYVVERDPLCVICIDNLARTYMLLDRFKDAERLLQRGLTLSPKNIDMERQLGENQLLQGDDQAALAWFETLPAALPGRLALRAMVLYALKRKEEVSEALAMLEEQSAHTALALYYAHTNDADSALRALKLGKAAKQNWIQFFTTEHLWAADITLDPKWQEFLEDVGLSARQIEELDLKVSVPG